MGTRSTYLVTQKRGEVVKPLMLLYFQFDGYPKGHPKEVAEWLSKGSLVNGLGLNKPEIVFNGSGCLAAQFVAKFKTEAGGQYLRPIDERGYCWEDYLYEINVDDDALTIEFACLFFRGDKTELYRGTPAGFVKMVNEGKLK